MTQSKTFIVMLIVLIVGFGAGFLLRSVIAPPAAPPMAQFGAASQSREALGIQYFVSNIEEARRGVEDCRGGSGRGAGCANAEEAIIKVEAEERRRRFLGQ